MIKLIKTVETYTKESFSKKCKEGMLLEKNFIKSKIFPANTNSKVFAGIYLGNYDVQTYGTTKVLLERNSK